MKEESLEEIMRYITRTFDDCQGLEYEILASTLVYLKNNPHVSIKDALDYGYLEWIK